MAQRSLTQILGTILTRLVVPAWVLTGAAFKLIERNAGNLPQQFTFLIRDWKLDAELVLTAFISLEIALAAVMVLWSRLARPAAIFTLSVFCLVLLIEMIVMGNVTKCGCMGNAPIAPWHMLIVDGLLLIGVVTCGPTRGSGVAGTSPQGVATPSKFGPALAALIAIAGAIGSYFWIHADLSQPQANNGQIAIANPDVPAKTDGTQPTETGSTQAPIPSNDPAINPNPLPPPTVKTWYTPNDVSVWVGQNWRDLELFQFMKRWPKNLDSGKHYVLFYSRTCDHCEEMFNYDLMVPLDAPVTAVEIPASDRVMTSPEGWMMPETPCELLALPLGKYLMTSPVALRIEDGKVTCATQGDHRQCLELE